MNILAIIDWLLDGDVSIQYLVCHDLLDTDRTDLREQIAKEGWGAEFLSYRNSNGHWGRGYYQPKWTSTHYTLLDIKNLGISPNCKVARETLDIVFDTETGPHGGIYPISTLKVSDVCINGMVLNFSSYFGVTENQLKSVIDFLLSQIMDDGGFNCMSNRKGHRIAPCIPRSLF